jgi:hypothetical protein
MTLTRLGDHPVLQQLASAHTTAPARPAPDPGLVKFIERLCPLRGKTRYASKQEARQFAATTPNLTKAYRCAVCDGYHLATRRRGRS